MTSSLFSSIGSMLILNFTFRTTKRSLTRLRPRFQPASRWPRATSWNTVTIGMKRVQKCLLRSGNQRVRSGSPVCIRTSAKHVDNLDCIRLWKEAQAHCGNHEEDQSRRNRFHLLIKVKPSGNKFCRVEQAQSRGLLKAVNKRPL